MCATRRQSDLGSDHEEQEQRRAANCEMHGQIERPYLVPSYTAAVGMRLSLPSNPANA